MAPLNPIVKLTIAVFVIIAAGFAVSFAFKNKIEASARKIYEARSMLKVLENRDENYLLLKTNYESAQEGLPILRQALPKEDGLDSVVSDLDVLAVQTGNTQNLNFESLKNSQNLSGMASVNFTANLTGNIDSFDGYLKKLRALPYFIEISNINIGNNSGVFSNNSRLTLNAKLYLKN